MAQYVYTMNRVGKVVPPKRVILKDISLSFFPGAKIGVLGLNGAGKSSLLRIMAGEDKEFDGEAAAAAAQRPEEVGVMIRRSVDLPDPFAPSTPILAPGKNDSEMSFRITRLGGTILPTRFIV